MSAYCVDIIILLVGVVEGCVSVMKLYACIVIGICLQAVIVATRLTTAKSSYSIHKRDLSRQTQISVNSETNNGHSK